MGQAVLSFMVRCPQFRVIQCIEVYGEIDDIERSGLFELSVLSQVSTIEGCRLTGIPLHMHYFGSLVCLGKELQVGCVDFIITLHVLCSPSGPFPLSLSLASSLLHFPLALLYMSYTCALLQPSSYFCSTASSA